MKVLCSTTNTVFETLLTHEAEITLQAGGREKKKKSKEPGHEGKR